MGLSGSLAAAMLATVGHLSLYVYLGYENKRRDKLSIDEIEREIQAGKSGDFHPDYRYTL